MRTQANGRYRRFSEKVGEKGGGDDTSAAYTKMISNSTFMFDSLIINLITTEIKQFTVSLAHSSRIKVQ